MNSSIEVLRRRPRNLALELVEALGDRIRDGRLAAGDKLPTEAAIMAEFEVSRTVVREAISRLQAGGLVETRHGIGTFVLGLGEAPGFSRGMGAAGRDGSLVRRSRPAAPPPPSVAPSPTRRGWGRI